MLIFFLVFFFARAIIQVEYLPSTNLVLPLYSHSMIYNPLTNEILIYGGIDSDGEKNFRVWGFELASSVFVEQTRSSSFVPMARSGHCSFYDKANERIVVIGGFTDTGVSDEILTQGLDMFVWRIHSKRLEKAIGDMACTVNSDLNLGYFFGGIGYEGIVEDIYQIDLGTLEVVKLVKNGDLPSARKNTGAVFFNNTIIVWGGENQGLVDTDTFQYSITENTWKKIKTYNSELIKARSMHQIAVQDNLLYVFPGKPFSNTTYILDLVTFNWTVIENALFQNRKSYSICTSSTILIYGGIYQNLVYNDILSLNLSNSFSVTPLSLVSQFPVPRIDSSLNTLYESLILFGGETYSQKKLNDLWKFESSWESLQVVGTVPSRRSGVGSISFGYSLFIFGGESETRLEQDLHQLSLIDMSWSRIEPKSIVPSPRKYPCICGRPPYIYIYGGLTITGWSSELWMYNIATYSFTLLSSSSLTSPGPNRVQSCVVNEVDKNNEILFVSPKEKNIWKFEYSFNLHGWKPPLQFPQLKITPNEIRVTKAFENTYLFSMNNIKESASNLYINRLDIIDDNIIVTGVANFSTYPVKCSFTMLSDKLYFFGGISMRSNAIRSPRPINRLITLSNFDVMLCSPGFYILNGSCVPCKAGTYNEELGATKCIECPLGTFNSNIGVSSNLMCLPCPSGTYSANVGASYCVECPISYYCPSGSNTPVLTQKAISEYSSENPIYSLGDQKKTDSINNYILIFIIVLNGLVIICAVSFNKSKNHLIKLDLFKSNHNYILDAEMRLKKNFVGGVFSVTAYSLAIYFLITVSVTYSFSNLIETKNIIPALIENNLIVAGDVNIQVDLDLYGGNCIGTNMECDSGISVTNLLDKYSSIDIQCEYIDTTCTIKIAYKDCVFLPKSSIAFTFSEPKSYASKITVNMTTFSSIPGQFSSVNNTISTVNEQSVFRGINPSKVFYEVLGSVFTENSVTLTGFHVTNIGAPLQGSEVEVNQAFITNSVSLIIDLSLSDTLLMIERIQKMEFLTFILTILSASLGAVSAVRFSMDFFEILYAGHKLRQKKQREILSMKENAKRLDAIINGNTLTMVNMKNIYKKKEKRNEVKIHAEQAEREIDDLDL